MSENIEKEINDSKKKCSAKRLEQAQLMRRTNVYIGGTQIAKMVKPKPTSSSSSGARGVVWLKNAKKMARYAYIQGRAPLPRDF